MKHKLFILMSLLAVSCKTSSRDDFGSQMTDVSVKIPNEFISYDSKISFSRIDSTAKPKVVRGSEVKVKLPSGIYKVDLTLTDKSGVETYRSCEIAKPYSFLNSKEEAIINICRSSDRALVAKTLTTSIIAPDPVPPIAKEPDPAPVPIPGTGTDPQPNELEPPLFFEEKTCFGLPATYEREGNELIIKMTGSIKDHLFNLTNSPKCSALMNIAKKVGQGFAPLNYQLTFEADQETLSQNNYVSVLVKDESTLQALPCKTLVLSNTMKSGSPTQCSFYDTSPERRFNVYDANKTPYSNSCAADSKQVKFDFSLRGVPDRRLKEIKLVELRIQIPLPEKCITPTN